MPIGRLLSEILQREDDLPDDGSVLHECRHCGSKFTERIEECPVRDGNEIATYEFGTEPSDPDDGS